MQYQVEFEIFNISNTGGWNMERVSTMFRYRVYNMAYRFQHIGIGVHIAHVVVYQYYSR